MTSEDKRKLKLIGWWFGIRVAAGTCALAAMKLLFLGMALVFKAV